MVHPVRRYLFSGHAIGAAARFHRLDKLENLDHVIPTLGASVLPATGGLSKSQVSNYCFQVDQPRKRSLLSVRRIEMNAEGRDRGGKYETEVEVDIDSLAIVEKLHIELIKVHLLSTRDAGNEEPSVSTKGNQIEGVRLGALKAKIVLDEERYAPPAQDRGLPSSTDCQDHELGVPFVLALAAAIVRLADHGGWCCAGSIYRPAARSRTWSPAIVR